MVQAFHEVLFPVPLGLAGRGGPQRQTEIVVQASGFEQRLSRWRHARRRYEIGCNWYIFSRRGAAGFTDSDFMIHWTIKVASRSPRSINRSG